MVQEVPQVREAVALVVVSPDDSSKVLMVKRPEDDDDSPGMWGLPAVTCRDSEVHKMAALRTGVQKLGVIVQLGRRLDSGTQERQGYTLNMALYEASLEGSSPELPNKDESSSNATYYTAWRWEAPSSLQESAAKGSLCSKLLLDNFSPK